MKPINPMPGFVFRHTLPDGVSTKVQAVRLPALRLGNLRFLTRWAFRLFFEIGPREKDRAQVRHYFLRVFGLELHLWHVDPRKVVAS